MPNSMLSHEELIRLLHYDPETGMFCWRVFRNCNACAGDIAGTIHTTVGGHQSNKIEINRKIYAASQLAFFYMMRQWPIATIDHINCDSLDDRWINLREATQKQQVSNRRPYRDLPKGVYRANSGYVASINVNGKKKHLGCRKTAEEAHLLYCEAAKRYFGEFARTK